MINNYNYLVYIYIDTQSLDKRCAPKQSRITFRYKNWVTGKWRGAFTKLLSTFLYWWNLLLTENVLSTTATDKAYCKFGFEFYNASFPREESMTKYLVKEHKNFTTLFSMRVCIIKFKKKNLSFLAAKRKRKKLISFRIFIIRKKWRMWILHGKPKLKRWKGNLYFFTLQVLCLHYDSDLS